MTDTGAQRPAVYLNTADLEALARLGLDEDEARAVIAARPLREWGDLKRVEGIDQDRINALKSAGADLGGPSSGPIREPGSGGSADSPAGNLGRA
ncbi:helix-hairpin-helix domain-containing protein [Roseibacterium beibuensis]|uniref:helix-hairpin-helix domain-containing protein n=1 Tax=[Roseibacterium] beibuensis TaxID=1193142 RepID=UPI00217DA865|nr:helix-hairpin-helix domain-containing protein [Roseibacterium beibuensis]MCS6627842.1 helix-hairpin-helix domain-containing protein [Roseibacterium beibuensis]